MEREVNLYVFVILEGGKCLKAGRLLSRNLHFPGNFEGFFRDDLLSESWEFGLSRKRALNLTEEVLDGMAGWERLFSEIPGEAAEGIRRRIRKRLGVFMGCL